MKQFNNLTIPIIFFGSSNYVIPILEVIRKNFDLKLVLTTEKSGGAVPSFCTQNKIPFLSVQQFNNSAIQQLQAIDTPIAILADFGLIIPDKILNLFPKGIINIHPSLLPKYRGPTPVQSAILNGDKITGISIMKLDDKVDHGPILAQEEEDILDNDTAETLYKRSFEIGAISLPKILNSYLEDKLKPIPQNHDNATFTKPLTRQDGYVALPAEALAKEGKLEIARKIRAYFPWPGVWTNLKIKDKELRVKLLPENKLQVEGKKPVNYKDFLNGYPDAKNIINFIK